MRKYFYCHNCKHEDKDFQFDRQRKDRDKVTWINGRDGYGRFIVHVICPKCEDVLSGYMEVRPNESVDKFLFEYLQYVLTMYQSENGMIINLEKLKADIKKDMDKRKGLI